MKGNRENRRRGARGEINGIDGRGEMMACFRSMTLPLFFLSPQPPPSSPS